MGICTCSNRVDETKIYLEFLNSLNSRNIKSEELIKKLKEKYITISKEEKKKSILLTEIFPQIESLSSEFKEYSHSYFDKYFENNKKDFFPLALLCSKESNFKKTFDEITIINRVEWSKNFSQDKKQIEKVFLKSIISAYIKFTTLDTISIIDKISGSNFTLDYLNNLFDNETRTSIVTDLFQPFEENNNLIDLESFFKSDQFKQKILNHEEILKMFLTYNSLKSSNK